MGGDHHTQINDGCGGSPAQTCSPLASYSFYMFLSMWEMELLRVVGVRCWNIFAVWLQGVSEGMHASERWSSEWQWEHHALPSFACPLKHCVNRVGSRWASWVTPCQQPAA